MTGVKMTTLSKEKLITGVLFMARQQDRKHDQQLDVDPRIQSRAGSEPAEGLVQSFPIVKRLFLLFVFCTATAWAQNDAALVTTVAGTATYQAAGGAAATPVQSFMKLRVGDRADIRAQARLNLVYLETGIVEQWDGPATFVVGKDRTSQIVTGTPISYRLPPAMVERLARAPTVVSQIRDRTGMTVTRGPRNSALINGARETYKQARSVLPADDISPELDLLIVYYQERLYEQAYLVAQDMQQRAPENLAVRELVERFKRALEQD